MWLVELFLTLLASIAFDFVFYSVPVLIYRFGIRKGRPIASKWRATWVGWIFWGCSFTAICLIYFIAGFYNEEGFSVRAGFLDFIFMAANWFILYYRKKSPKSPSPMFQGNTTITPTKTHVPSHKCSACGIVLPLEAQFCPKCGKEVTPPILDGMIICPACSNTVINNKYCTECGNKLAVDAPTINQFKQPHVTIKPDIEAVQVTSAFSSDSKIEEANLLKPHASPSPDSPSKQKRNKTVVIIVVIVLVSVVCLQVLAFLVSGLIFAVDLISSLNLFHQHDYQNGQCIECSEFDASYCDPIYNNIKVLMSTMEVPILDMTTIKAELSKLPSDYKDVRVISDQCSFLYSQCEIIRNNSFSSDPKFKSIRAAYENLWDKESDPEYQKWNVKRIIQSFHDENLYLNGNTFWGIMCGYWKSSNGYYFEYDGEYVDTNIPHPLNDWTSSVYFNIDKLTVSVSKTPNGVHYDAYKITQIEKGKIVLYCYKTNNYYNMAYSKNSP